MRTWALSTSSTICCPNLLRPRTWRCRCGCAAWAGPKRASWRWTCWRRWGWASVPSTVRPSCRAASPSAWRLLADEPTGNLDRNTAEQVFGLMLQLARDHNTAFVLVTHDEQLAARCDRQFRMDRGQLMPMQEQATQAA